VKTEMFRGVSDFSCKYTHGTSTVGGRGKATVRTTVRTDIWLIVMGIIYCISGKIENVME